MEYNHFPNNETLCFYFVFKFLKEIYLQRFSDEMLQLTGTEDMIYSLSSIQGFRNCVPEFIHLLGKKKSQGRSLHTCSWKDSTDISWPNGYKHHCFLLVSLRPRQDDLWRYLIFLMESFKADQAETHMCTLLWIVLSMEAHKADYLGSWYLRGLLLLAFVSVEI